MTLHKNKFCKYCKKKTRQDYFMMNPIGVFVCPLCNKTSDIKTINKKLACYNMVLPEKVIEMINIFFKDNKGKSASFRLKCQIREDEWKQMKDTNILVQEVGYQLEKNRRLLTIKSV